MTYEEKLLDPRWQKKRLEIFQRDDFTCVCCDRKDITLHVHHLFYFPNTEPWDYLDSHLVTYCEICHNTEHLIGSKLTDSLVEIVQNNHLLIQPVAQLCILCEKHLPFVDHLKKFLKSELVSYLESRKIATNGQEKK
jgi:PHP family Zn ribbon phosphoesterase